MFQNIFQITWNLLHFLMFLNKFLMLHNPIHLLAVHASQGHCHLHVNHPPVTSHPLIEVTPHASRR
jgi:hypothetical protein